MMTNSPLLASCLIVMGLWFDSLRSPPNSLLTQTTHYTKLNASAKFDIEKKRFNVYKLEWATFNKKKITKIIDLCVVLV